MGQFSEQFFREYEEIYSDSEKLNASPQFDEERENGQYRERSRPDARGRDRRDRAGSQRTARPARYGGAYDSRGDFDSDPYTSDIYGRERYRSALANFEQRPDRRDPRASESRKQPVKRKKRMSRRSRRIVMVSALVCALLIAVTCLIAIVRFTGRVGQVSSLKAIDVSSDSIVLSWQPVSHADSYRVSMATDGSDDYETYQDTEETTLTVSDLEQGTAYSFSVTAVRGGKEGKPAELENVYTSLTAPQITGVFSPQTGTIHVDWSPNTKASGYIVQYKKDGGSYSEVKVSGAEECRTDITGLEPNASYSVRVYAYLDGDGPLDSSPSEVQTVSVIAQESDFVPKATDKPVDGGIDPDKPMIALTFDDGPAVGGDSGDRILDVLEKYNAKATFFMLGCNAGECPENLQRKVRLGMEIGNHTWNHTHYGNEVVPEDIRKASSAIYDVCGQFPTCFRSPGGMTTKNILTECAAENMSAYYWTIDTEDWNSRDADAVYHAVVDHVSDGDIVLMHEIYGSTADAMEKIVPELIDRGYQLVTCHDLVACKSGEPPVPGVQYVNGTRVFEP